MVIRDKSGVRGSEFTEWKKQERLTGQAIASLTCFPLPCMQILDNFFIHWNPEECVSINKLAVSAKNLWLPDIFITES